MTMVLEIFLTQLSLIISYAGMVQGCFVAFLLNNKGVRKNRANTFLSILLVSLSFSIAHILFSREVIMHISAKVYSLGDPTFLLIGPLLLLYTKELTGQKVNITWKLSLHFIPFFAIILLSLSLRSVSDEENFNRFLYTHTRVLNVLFWILMFVQFSVYQYFIHQKWQAYQTLLQQEVSNTENVSITWVRFFMTVFLFVNVFFFFSLGVVIHVENNMWLDNFIAVIFSLSVFSLGYKGILQREVFDTYRMKDMILEKPLQLNENKKTAPDSALIDKLCCHMEQKKPYLDPELTLSNLAKDLEISRSQLSQLINDGIGENFYDFVNKYRVEEVKKLMIDPSVKNYNILGIALEAGFKSKSTFNLIFKRFTGITPTEYRKNLAK
jgi:AraC-like DNA-binding protein